jgi:hypothetical protein
VRTFLALYRGATVGEAELLAVSADPDMVADVAARLLHVAEQGHDDPVLRAKRRGARVALSLVRREAIGDRETD